MGMVTSIVGVSLLPLTLAGYDKELIFETQANLILNLMPKGTKLLGFDDLNVVDLALKRVYKFEHPIFKDGTTVELYYNRDFALENDKIVNYNVLTGIQYFNPDGTKRY